MEFKGFVINLLSLFLGRAERAKTDG